MTSTDDTDLPRAEHRGHGYELVRELGHTPEAHRRTWEATHVASGDPVVLKAYGFGESTLPWGGYKHDQIESLLALDHSRVPRYREMYRLTDDRGFCLVQTLHPAAKLHTGVIWPQQVAARVGVQLLELLVYLEDRIVPPVVHRDLAPQNILLSPLADSDDDRVDVRVVDFLLVRDELGALQPSSREAGAPGFNAPEELRGAPVDVRCDLYSLGMTLACLVTGVHEDDVLELRDGSALARERMAGVDPRLVEWLDTVTADEPNERPHHARTALKKLGLFIDELPDGDVPARPSVSADASESPGEDLDSSEVASGRSEAADAEPARKSLATSAEPEVADAQPARASQPKPEVADARPARTSQAESEVADAQPARRSTVGPDGSESSGSSVDAVATGSEVASSDKGSAASDFFVAMALLFGIGLVVVILVALLG